MARTLNERDRAQSDPAVRCEVRWPTDSFSRFRRHVELAEFGEKTLEAQLDYCLPGKDRESSREDEKRRALSVVRLYADHPDVESGIRKASEIWLARKGLIALEPKEGSIETNRRDGPSLVDLVAKVRRGEEID
jgi:hypothetical protein